MKAICHLRVRHEREGDTATVEPVFGTLTQFMGLRKINTIGIRQANKVMHLSAMTYNLKKYLKFTKKLIKRGTGAANSLQTIKKATRYLKSSLSGTLNFE